MFDLGLWEFTAEAVELAVEREERALPPSDWVPLRLELVCLASGPVVDDGSTD